MSINILGEIASEIASDGVIEIWVERESPYQIVMTARLVAAAWMPARAGRFAFGAAVMPWSMLPAALVAECAAVCVLRA